MRKCFVTLAALLITAGLIYAAMTFRNTVPSPSAPSLRLIRIWIREEEPGLNGWLKKMAAEYEKQNGARVFLRRASKEEAQAVLNGETNDPAPDILVLPNAGQAIALRGFALILRDDSMRPETPKPTGALFFRPSPTPGPTLSPAPWPDADALGAVLAPAEMADRMPGTVICPDPAAQLAKGKARAALLTAGQAARLPFGFRFFSLPDGRGFLPIGADALSESGNAFLSFLLSPGCQQRLREVGLYSPTALLYSSDDPIRYWIDTSRGSSF